MRNAAFEASDGFKNSEPPDTLALWPAFAQSLKLLRPGAPRTNPALLMVEIAAIVTTSFLLYAAICKAHHPQSLPYLISLDFWLVLGVLATNFVTVLTRSATAQLPG